MSDTKSFVIDKKTKKLIKKVRHSSEYWRLGGDLYGTIDMEIEVFALANHEAHAKQLYTILSKGGLTDKLVSVRIEIAANKP